MALLACAVSAQEGPVAVESTTDFRGSFTYTFAHSNYPWCAFFGGTSEGIVVQCFGITNYTVPPGWILTAHTGDVVGWYYPEGTFYLDHTSITFSLQTTWTNFVEYTNALGAPFYGQGVIGAHECRTNERGGEIVFFQKFCPVGPAVPHVGCASSAPSAVVLTLADTYGASCTVERVDSLLGSSWQGATCIPAVVGTTNVVLPAEGNGPFFFRFRSK